MSRVGTMGALAIAATLASAITFAATSHLGSAEAADKVSVTKAQLRINQRISQAAVRRSNQANAAIRAQDARIGRLEGAGAPGTAGATSAQASVAADGSVERGRSTGLGAARVVKGQGAAGTGFYCVYGLPFTPRTAVASATIDFAKTTGPFSVGAMTYVARAGETVAISGCDTSGLQVVVRTYDAEATGLVDSGFTLWIAG